MEYRNTAAYFRNHFFSALISPIFLEMWVFLGERCLSRIPRLMMKILLNNKARRTTHLTCYFAFSLVKVCVCVFVSSFLCEDRNLHSTILVRTNSHVCVCICDCVSVYWRGIGWIIVFLNQQNPKTSFISVLSDADHMIDIDPCCRPFMNKRSIIFKVKF